MISKKNNAIVVSMITFGTNSASCVPDELPLGHLVLDVGRAQVDREENQGEAHHVSDERLRSGGQRIGWNATIITIKLDVHDNPNDLHRVNGHGQGRIALAESNLEFNQSSMCSTSVLPRS